MLVDDPLAIMGSGGLACLIHVVLQGRSSRHSSYMDTATFICRQNACMPMKTAHTLIWRCI
jgi:hypothetical protein